MKCPNPGTIHFGKKVSRNRRIFLLGFRIVALRNAKFLKQKFTHRSRLTKTTVPRRRESVPILVDKNTKKKKTNSTFSASFEIRSKSDCFKTERRRDVLKIGNKFKKTYDSFVSSIRKNLLEFLNQKFPYFLKATGSLENGHRTFVNIGGERSCVI